MDRWDPVIIILAAIALVVLVTFLLPGCAL